MINLNCTSGAWNGTCSQLGVVGKVCTRCVCFNSEARRHGRWS